MKSISEYREEAYYSATDTASSIARQLGFAGIAIIWIFKHGDAGVLTVPKELLWPGFFNSHWSLV